MANPSKTIDVSETHHNNTKGIVVIVILFVGWILLNACFYTVQEQEQAILTQFGSLVGKPVTTPGLHMKVPFIQDVTKLEKRILEWDGPTSQMTTKDETYIMVEAFARWSIGDAQTFYVKLKDERSALSRMDDLIGGEIRVAVAKHDLIEIVRTDKDRKVSDKVASSGTIVSDTLPKIELGRVAVEKEIRDSVEKRLADLGIILLDVRFRRINYNVSVNGTIYDRMKSDRKQIADRFRSEGSGEAADVLGKRDRELAEIQSTAYKRTQEIQGEADAKATEIYAKAFNQSPQAVEFYRFIKTMETYEQVFMGGDSTLLLSTDSELLKLLKGAGAVPPAGALTPTPAPAKPLKLEPIPAPEKPQIPPAPVAPAINTPTTPVPPPTGTPPQ